MEWVFSGNKLKRLCCLTDLPLFDHFMTVWPIYLISLSVLFCIQAQVGWVGVGGLRERTVLRRLLGRHGRAVGRTEEPRLLRHVAHRRTALHGEGRGRTRGACSDRCRGPCQTDKWARQLRTQWHRHRRVRKSQQTQSWSGENKWHWPRLHEQLKNPFRAKYFDKQKVRKLWLM